MKITIECDNLKELKSVLEGMMVYQPEKTEKKPETKTAEPSEKKQTREKEEVEKVRAKYDEIHDKILNLRKKGKRPSEIAKETGISVATVYNHLRREADE